MREYFMLSRPCTRAMKETLRTGKRLRRLEMNIQRLAGGKRVGGREGGGVTPPLPTGGFRTDI
jgi:hypothetical protein